MRKEFVGHRKFAEKSPGDAEWLDLESIAHAQITSEDRAFPIENALSTNPEGNELGCVNRGSYELRSEVQEERVSSKFNSPDSAPAASYRNQTFQAFRNYFRFRSVTRALTSGQI